ncbi:MAG: ATP-binding cassette domain-containing protein [Rhodoglobus sp.]
MSDVATNGRGGPLVVEGVGKSFGDRRLWSDMSFRLNPGELTALVGPSGSGKTTLLNCLGLLEPCDSGRLLLDGRDVRKLSSRERRLFFRETVGFLFQGYGLIESWSVARNMQIALAYSGLGKKTRGTLIDETLVTVGLAGMNKRKVFTLSGGEQQRLGLARLILKAPRIVCADEPTAALDQKNADMVVSALTAFADRGAIVVISTHDSSLIQQVDAVIALTAPTAEERAHMI